ncbi:MAG: 16S rRNA (guanine(966)-N(2))-methyltransferase RsmD [Polyangiaceae bacterium]|nr:16S rRNA (guanine(966)-N(2))-methyltransferase RsmD [Polyangiaceae bacterium]
MRISGGVFRGRKLKVAGGAITRPTTERVREALFNLLGNAVIGQSVLDIYAGSGSLGLEALSRGASKAVFVDTAKAATDAIRANIAAIAASQPSIADSTTVFKRPIENCIDSLRLYGPFGLVLVDPPFASVRDHSAIRAIELVVAANLLAPNAELILEYPSELPNLDIAGLVTCDIRSYGDTKLAFFRKSDALCDNHSEAVEGL